VFFPTAPALSGTTCQPVAPITSPPQIGVEPAPAFLTDWLGHFSAPGWKTIQSTPLADALVQAQAAVADPFPFPGARAVVVLTDGAPTCVTDKAKILAPVQAMAVAGVRTFAVGLPGSAGAATLLDAIASAGGTGQYLTPADPAALTAALGQIAAGTLDPCNLTLSPAAPDPTQVYLYVTDASGMRVEVPMSDGWSVSADGATATLTGTLCDAAKNGTLGAVQFVFGCPLSGPN
jgi:hypothetical protein